MSHAARRSRFLAWYESTYGRLPPAQARAKFTKATGRIGGHPLSKGRVSQFFDPDQPFGESAARNLGKRLGLGADWFLVDRPEFGRAPSPVDIAAPRAPAPDFRDRMEVSESDFALLQDIKTVMESPRGAAQVEELRKEAAAMAAFASRYCKPPK